jgi:hypothetical protein
MLTRIAVLMSAARFSQAATIAMLVALLAIVFALVYEPLPGGLQHINRLTLAICSVDKSCWL